MKRHISLFLIATMIVAATPLSVYIQAQTTPAAASDELTNEIVIKMLKDGLSSEIVLAKIRTSATRFDTSPAALNRLKEAGVPDAIILVMIESSGIAAGPAVPGTPALAEVKVPDGTELVVELSRDASSQELKVGDTVDLSVVSPVVVDGVTIIEKGASARAQITTAKSSRYWGRAGKLEWAMKDVLAVDGSRVPARFTKRSIGDSKGGTVAAATVATSMLVGPFALLWGLKKGKPAVILGGTRYTVFIQGDVTLKGRPVAAAVAPTR